MDNYREKVFDRVFEQLDKLVLKESDGSPRQISSIKVVAPNDGFLTPVWVLNKRPVLPSDYCSTQLIPSIFISFQGGRISPEVGTYLENKVETIGVRIETVLNVGHGAPSSVNSMVAKDLTPQISDVLNDFDRLLNVGSLRTLYEGEFISGRTNESTHVVDANIVEWGFDPNNRGTPFEILITVFEVMVSAPRQPEETITTTQEI